MTWRRPHWRERPSHPEDDLRPHDGNKSAHAYQFPLARMPRTGMEDERFFHQQANWCYTSRGSALIWPCRMSSTEWGTSSDARALVAGTEGTADAEARRS